MSDPVGTDSEWKENGMSDQYKEFGRGILKRYTQQEWEHVLGGFVLHADTSEAAKAAKQALNDAGLSDADSSIYINEKKNTVTLRIEPETMERLDRGEKRLPACNPFGSRYVAGGEILDDTEVIKRYGARGSRADQFKPNQTHSDRAVNSIEGRNEAWSFNK